jgi:molecular chaperone HscB
MRLCRICDKHVDALVCDACHTVQSAAGVDRFAAMGFPRKFSLDAGELETRHRDLSRKLHPDRFAKADPKDRVASLQAATALNDAYRTLRSPVARAAYLLELEGMSPGDNDPVEPEFLMEIMELRETLSDAKEAGDTAQVTALEAAMRQRFDGAMARLADRFTRHELTHDRQHLAEARRELVAIRYFQRFLDEAEGIEAI